MPALDGVRGIAILLVFGFHLPWGAFRTGSIGVVLFFVLSGFLITSVLLTELEDTGTVLFRRFYLRRAARLLPALVVVVIGYLLLQVLVFGEPNRWWERTWPALIYVANIVAITGGDLGHMTPTWSLSIEEHFYLLWPVTLLMVPRRWRFNTALVLAGVFLLWRVLLLVIGSPSVRISFGTDTNAFAPILGCALAIGMREGRFKAARPNASALYLTLLVAIANLPVHYTDRLTVWMAIPVGLLSALAVHAAATSPVPWLEISGLRWFGKISYGLYLWHFILIGLPWDRLPLRPLFWRMTIPVLVAWLSWRLVEEPILEWAKRWQSSSWSATHLAGPLPGKPTASFHGTSPQSQ